MPCWEYPPTRRDDRVDEYHGVQVPDPFRWLEDVEAPETRDWIEAQNRLTRSVLDRIASRPAIRERLEALWDFPRAWPPRKRGGRYFQLRNDGLQDQNVLVVLDALDAEPTVVVDPHVLRGDGTAAIAAWSPSHDGRHVAFGVSSSGSDWLTWRVRDVMTGEDLPDEVRWSKFSGASWLPDDTGFLYGRYEEPQPGLEHVGAHRFHKVCLHRLGTGQASDEVVYERPDHPDWGFDAQVSEDGRYLVLGVWVGTDTRNLLFWRELDSRGPFVELVSELQAGFRFLGNVGSTFLLWTDLDAPLGRVVAVDTARPARDSQRTVIPEGRDVLDDAVLAGGELVAVYLHHGRHRLERFDMDGHSLAPIDLPGMGSIVAAADGTTLSASADDDELFFACHGYTLPPTVYRCRLPDGRPDVVHQPRIDFDEGRYETRQVFVDGRDGTRVPMIVVGNRDGAGTGPRPTLLTGYGGFRHSVTPSFSPALAAWLEMGGVLAVATLRGGGEYGRAWHEAGTLERKQNVFDDFIACAEHLVETGVTEPSKLAIWGASNGGLLVGACMTQRPELFGAVLPAVGVMDMLRFHRFTIGWAWVSDYGSADDPDHFPFLHAYSPLHNVRPGTAYPATLILTADHDDRVVPGHSLKFAAALQAAQAGPAPVLARIQTRAGHGAGKPTSVSIEEFADAWSFLTAALGRDDWPDVPCPDARDGA